MVMNKEEMVLCVQITFLDQTLDCYMKRKSIPYLSHHICKISRQMILCSEDMSKRVVAC